MKQKSDRAVIMIKVKQVIFIKKSNALSYIITNNILLFSYVFGFVPVPV